MVLAGNVALESMGFETFGFGGGRVDAWEPDDDVYWGPESTWLADERYSGERELEDPLAAVQMGLIYVNPEGPNGNPDPLAAAHDIRETFRRMAMNDEETVALIAGGHTFGKTHGAGDARQRRARAGGGRARGAGLRLAELLRHGHGRRRDHRRARGHLDDDADAVEQRLLPQPVRVRVGADARAPPVRSSGSRRTARERARRLTPADPSQRRAPAMLTTDLALRFDPIYEPISRRFYEHPDEFADAFARAWFKLTHRDMGPVVRYLGPEVPSEVLIWQDPVPPVEHALLGAGASRRAEGADRRVRLDGLAARHDRLGVGVDVPRQRQARRRQRGAHPPRAAAQLGGQRARRARRRCSRRSRGFARPPLAPARGSRSPT